MSNFCKHCIFWAHSYESGLKAMGVCNNSQVIESIEKDTEFQQYEEGVLHTEAHFGCVYFRAQSLNATKIEMDYTNDALNYISRTKKCSNCGEINAYIKVLCKQCGCFLTYTSRNDIQE